MYYALESELVGRKGIIQRSPFKKGETFRRKREGKNILHKKREQEIFAVPGLLSSRASLMRKLILILGKGKHNPQRLGRRSL